MPSYLCNTCDRIAHRPFDAAVACPTCQGRLVEVDVSLDIMACPGCEYFEAGRLSAEVRVKARCPSCKRSLKRINRAETTDATGRRVPRLDPPPQWMLYAAGIYGGVVIDGIVAFAAAAIFGRGVPPDVKAGAVIFAPVLLYVMWAMLRGIVRDVADPAVRANHAIEHAAIALLEKEGKPMSWGHSGRSGFWVSGEVSRDEVERAAASAIERLRGGEPDLRIHPCCGGRFLVDLLVVTAMTAVLPVAVVATVVRPVLWPTLLIAPVLWFLRGTLTSLLQRFGTTTARFKEARVDSVKRREDAYFVATSLTF